MSIIIIVIYYYYFIDKLFKHFNNDNNNTNINLDPDIKVLEGVWERIKVWSRYIRVLTDWGGGRRRGPTPPYNFILINCIS